MEAGTGRGPDTDVGSLFFLKISMVSTWKKKGPPAPDCTDSTAGNNLAGINGGLNVNRTTDETAPTPAPGNTNPHTLGWKTAK